MGSLAERFGLEAQRVERIDLLKSARLPDAEALLKAAFEAGATNPEDAQTLLAAALVATAEQTADGRHCATLCLLAPLVAKSDPYMTLGPNGAAIRADVMPNGWRYTISSWPRLRYAWREGLGQLLRIGPEDAAVVTALDEVTRMNPAEPEPVSVSIQEQWPAPGVSFAVAALSLGLTGWQIWSMRRRAR